MRYRLIILAVIMVLNNLSAQYYNTGLIFDDEAYYDIPMLTRKSLGSKGENKLLDNVLVVDLKPYCPRIKHQGQIGSCVGWSTGYAGQTIEYAIRKGWKNMADSINKYAFSALFVYNQIKIRDCESGAYIGKAFDVLQNKGNLKSKEFDEDANNCLPQPTEAQLIDALNYRISDYASLFAPNDSASFKINRTKLSLAQNKPVIVSLVLRKNFMYIDSEGVWNPMLGDTLAYGGHAMCVVGFNEGLGAFEIMNSWGPNWANKGYCWIKYSDFANFCKYAFQINIASDKLIAFNNYFAQAKVNISKPYIVGGKLKFQNLLGKFEDNIYKFNISNGTKFQIQLDSLIAGNYLYFINYSFDGKASLCFPEMITLADGNKITESSKIVYNDTQISLPDPASCFTIENDKTEYFILLVTDKKIDKIEKKLNDLERLPKDSFMEGFNVIFEPNFVFPKTRNDGSLVIQSEARSGKITPIVFQVNTFGN